MSEPWSHDLSDDCPEADAIRAAWDEAHSGRVTAEGAVFVRCAQGTDRWKKLRLGIPTASVFDQIITPSGKPSASAPKLMHRLLAEWLLGREEEDAFAGSYWTDRGTELEPSARAYYEFQRGIKLDTGGFFFRDECRTVGCSPDWRAGEDGLGEIKCPKASTHIGYLLDGELAKTYRPQVQGQLWVTRRKWVDFMSYHPGLPELIVRVERDDDFHDLLDEHVGGFIDKMMQARRRLSELSGKESPF